MATVQDKMDTIKGGNDYVSGSLILKSYDEVGLVLKWLEGNQDGTADRKEMFIETDVADKKKSLTRRAALNDIIVNNAV